MEGATVLNTRLNAFKMAKRIFLEDLPQALEKSNAVFWKHEDRKELANFPLQTVRRYTAEMVVLSVNEVAEIHELLDTLQLFGNDDHNGTIAQLKRMVYR
jgi:hypothetical protein